MPIELADQLIIKRDSHGVLVKDVPETTAHPCEAAQMAIHEKILIP
jgi:hypothetical protein